MEDCVALRVMRLNFAVVCDGNETSRFGKCRVWQFWFFFLLGPPPDVFVGSLISPAKIRDGGGDHS